MRFGSHQPWAVFADYRLHVPRVVDAAADVQGHSAASRCRCLHVPPGTAMLPQNDSTSGSTGAPHQPAAAAVSHHLLHTVGAPQANATATEIMHAVAQVARERLSERWVAGEASDRAAAARRVAHCARATGSERRRMFLESVCSPGRLHHHADRGYPSCTKASSARRGDAGIGRSRCATVRISCRDRE